MRKLIIGVFLLVPMGWGVGRAQTPPSSEQAPSQAQESPARKDVSERYDLALGRGVSLLNEKRYEEAIGSFQEALLARPNDTEAAYYLGATQRLSGQYELSYATLKQVDSSFQKAHFDLGVSAYHTKRYDESILSLTLALPFETGAGARQAMVPYYLGLNYLQLGRLEEAAPQFLRASALSNELEMSARYYSGVVFYRQGIFEEAEEAFDEVIAGQPEDAPESPMIQSAKTFLKEIEKKSPKIKRGDLTVSLSIQQDSNVVLAPEDAALRSNISNEEDLRTVVVLNGGFKLFQTDRSTVRAQYQFYQSLHQELTRFDVQSHDVGLRMGHHPAPERPYRFEFAYHYSNALVDGNDYLKTGVFSSAIDLLKKPKRITRLEYRFSDKDFINSATSKNNDDRTGTNHLLDVSFKRVVSARDIKLNNGFIYDQESTRGTDWEYQGFRVYLSGRWPSVRGLFDPTVKAEVGVRMYDNPHTLSATTPKEKREDQIQTYTLTLTRSFRKNLFGSFQYQTNINGSNISAFDYKRQITSMNVVALF